MRIPKIFLICILIFSSNIFFAQNSYKPELRVQIGHTGIITCVSFSPDNKLVLSASRDNTLKLWEVATGRLIRTFEGHSASVASASFSPDGNTAVSGSEDGMIFLWDITTGKIIKQFEKNDYEVRSVCYSPDGEYIAAAVSNTIMIQNVNSGKLIKTITGHTSTISRISFSPDGKYIVSAAIKELKIWNAETGELFREFEKNDLGYLSPNFSPDGKDIVTGGGDRVIRIRDIATGKVTRTFEGHESRVTATAFTPDGKNILSGSDDKSIILWNISSGQKIISFDSHNDDIRAIDFSSDGQYVISCSSTEIMLSETETGRFIRQFEGHTTSFSSCVYTPDGKYALSGSSDNTMKLWDIYSAKLLKTFEGHSEMISSVAFSPDGKYAVSGSWDNSVIIWKIDNGKPVKTFNKHNWYVTSVSFSKDGKYIASGSFDNTARIWNIEKEELYKSFEYSDQINSVAYSPDGNKLLLASRDGKLLLWDYNSDKYPKIFEGHREGATTAVFSPDGKYIFSGSNDFSMKMWDASTGKMIKSFEGHTARVMGVGISPDGKYVATGSTDNRLKIWDIKSGDELANLISFQNKDFIAVTPDNYYYCSKNGVKVIAFVIGNHAYPPEQFDLQYNRPDIVLERIGSASKELIDAYKNAYEKRLKKMEFNEDMFNKDFHLPEAKLTGERIPVSTENKNFSFKVKAEDSKYKLDRINVFLNDVPVPTSAGTNLKDLNTNSAERQINLELCNRKNKIQFSVLNEKGAESLKETFEINYEGKISKPDLYVVTIGASEYNDSKYKLKYASKDVKDVAELFSAAKEKYGNIKTYSLLDKDVTKENILKIKDFLMQTKTDDKVILFAAGHGILNKNFDYYFATADMDFKNPEMRGVTFEEIENLLDGIPAKQKVLFMDTCHSGEIDKDEIKEIKKKKTETGEVVFRDFGESEYESGNESLKKLGLKNTMNLLQEMFVNLRRGSGAVIISSAGGMEFAWEGGEFKNGLFTYCLLEGIKSGNADLNHDGEITISELKEYVTSKVEKLTRGAQKPTSRRENYDFDFVIW